MDKRCSENNYEVNTRKKQKQRTKINENRCWENKASQILGIMKTMGHYCAFALIESDTIWRAEREGYDLMVSNCFRSKTTE